jgi:fructosamine-3-kinase
MSSYRQAVASGIMHLGMTVDKRSKSYFAKCIKKAMANQIAYENIQLLKQQEQEYIAATLAKQAAAQQSPAAVPASTNAEPDEKQPQIQAS